MKRIIFILFVSFSLNSFGQVKEKIYKPQGFKYPVMAKLIDGQGNVFRIGFIRHNDYFDLKEDEGEITSYYARFLNESNLTNSVFVYFPTSPGNGEMLIVNKTSVTKLDMTYEQAMQIILPDY